jgi:actin-related protein 6
MMEETYIVNEVKEKCCYVSTQFSADLETCRFAPCSGLVVSARLINDNIQG